MPATTVLPEYLVIGDDVLVHRLDDDGSRCVDVLWLPAIVPSPLQPFEFMWSPWSDSCDACGGTGLHGGGDDGLEGPCGPCHGSGVVVFVFHRDRDAVAEILPARLGAPYAYEHPEIAP